MENAAQVPPIAFMIFNRPDKTARVFEAIRKARPAKLFIIADGPRNEEERVRCESARKITEHIDWPCAVERNYAPANMGCSPRIYSGISWVFSQVDRAVFLEDDCLPHQDFFRFCAELLEKYENEEHVMHISGDNFQQGNKDFRCSESYYFSIIPQQQGWATWQRAWKLYDPVMSVWPAFQKSTSFTEAFPDPAVREHWRYKFQRHYEDPTNTTWDGKWAFACVFHRGYSIDPKVNLISNIGYGADATHKKTVPSNKANLPTESIGFPLIHPHVIAPNEQADAYEAKYYRGINLHLKQRVLWFVRSHFPRTYRFFKSVFGQS